MNTPAAEPASEKKEPRVYLNDRGEGTFICPACDKGVIRDLNQFVNATTAVRLKCKCQCGHVYRVLVERRRHFRKPVSLVGMAIYRKEQGPPAKGLIKITDISKTGVRFSINSPPEYQEGDTLLLEFTLDNKDRSTVRQEGIVRRIEKSMVGVEFEHVDQFSELHRYLFR